MGIGANISQGTGYSNSANSAQAANWSNSQQSSNTNGSAATAASINAASVQNQAALDAMKLQMEYNAREAKKARDWQEKMQNSVYQRTVVDMIKAGINPVLAAGAGLGTASVGTGTSASVSAPNMAMANAYPDTVSSGYSASEGYSHSQGYSHSEQEMGLATALTELGQMIGSWVNNKNSAQDVNFIFKDMMGNDQSIGDVVKTQLSDFLGPNFVEAFFGDKTWKPKTVDGITFFTKKDYNRYISNKNKTKK